MHQFFSLWNSMRQHLIPQIEENVDILSEKENEFVRIAELASVDKFIKEYKWLGNGRKLHYGKSIVLTFIVC
jgi:hypothetical protein